MFGIRNKAIFMVLVSTFLLVGGVGKVSQSFAAEAVIPYSTIGSNEYQFPMDFDEPINLFLSYNVWQNTTESYGPDGPDMRILASGNKFARLFKIDGLDNVGFLWEVVLTYAGVGIENGTNMSGMADPQTGIVAWIKPAPNWTTALEYWLHVPLGSNDLTDGAVSHTFAWLNGHKWGNVCLDWDLGYKIRGDQRKGGARAEQGDSFFGNAVLTYNHNAWLGPFLHVDYETAGHGKNKDTGAIDPSYDRLQLGLGNTTKITDRLVFAYWYSRGIAGRNVARPSAVYGRFIWSF